MGSRVDYQPKRHFPQKNVWSCYKKMFQHNLSTDWTMLFRKIRIWSSCLSNLLKIFTYVNCCASRPRKPVQCLYFYNPNPKNQNNSNKHKILPLSFSDLHTYRTEHSSDCFRIYYLLILIPWTRDKQDNGHQK